MFGLYVFFFFTLFLQTLYILILKLDTQLGTDFLSIGLLWH